jgi:uncharacterized protein YlzI (FlbEa/FlbD family)
MLGWIKKKILKSIINDVTKQLPTYKKKAVAIVEEHKDEVLDKVKEYIKKAVMDFIKSKTDI